MTTLILLAAIATWFVGWFTFTVLAARYLAEHMEACLEERPYRGDGLWCSTHVGGGHWRGDGTVGPRELWVAALPGLVWPLALVPLAALTVANRKPTAKANRLRIAELEAQLGIGDKAA